MRQTAAETEENKLQLMEDLDGYVGEVVGASEHVVELEAEVGDLQACYEEAKLMCYDYVNMLKELSEIVAEREWILVCIRGSCPLPMWSGR